jgi:hypothetical protein
MRFHSHYDELTSNTTVCTNGGLNKMTSDTDGDGYSGIIEAGSHCGGTERS